MGVRVGMVNLVLDGVNGLNVCVLPKFICWSPNLQCAIFGGGASKEGIKVKQGHRGGALI